MGFPVADPCDTIMYVLSSTGAVHSPDIRDLMPNTSGIWKHSHKDNYFPVSSDNGKSPMQRPLVREPVYKILNWMNEKVLESDLEPRETILLLLLVFFSPNNSRP